MLSLRCQYRRLVHILNLDIVHPRPLISCLLSKILNCRLCVLIYRCLTGTAPHYLAETICPVSNRGARQHLWSAETSTLPVPSTRRSTLGDRSFSVAAARAWNTLPQSVHNAPSLPVFRRESRSDDRSVAAVVPWCDLTMYRALSIRPSFGTDLSLSYRLLQTDFNDIVRWSCSSSAIMPPNIHFYHYYYYYYSIQTPVYAPDLNV